MTKPLTTAVEKIRDAAEGSHDADEQREPLDPLQTMVVPVIRMGPEIIPSAETGVVSVIMTQAEGHEFNEGQDSSRTTAETRVMPETQRAPDPRPSRAPSVLILEDTTELGEVIQATLERMSMVAVHETHGNKALTRFDEMKPDIVLLDIGLPDMTGWKFLETIKEKCQDNLPMIIVITAYGDPANRLVGKLQGVRDYLIKPFTADEVERVVTNALSGG